MRQAEEWKAGAQVSRKHVKALCDAGMFVRRIDPQDARRAFIELGDVAAQAMLDYLGALRGDGPVI